MLTIQQIVNERRLPFRFRKIRALIENGEKRKRGEYEGDDYLEAVNTSPSDKPKAKRWHVPESELSAFLERKRNK